MNPQRRARVLPLVGKSTRVKRSLRKRIFLGGSSLKPDIHPIQSWLLLGALGWPVDFGPEPRPQVTSLSHPFASLPADLIASPRAGLLPCALNPGHPVCDLRRAIRLGFLLLGLRDLPISVMSLPSLRGSLRNGGAPCRELEMLQPAPAPGPTLV